MIFFAPCPLGKPVTYKWPTLRARWLLAAGQVRWLACPPAFDSSPAQKMNATNMQICVIFGRGIRPSWQKQKIKRFFSVASLHRARSGPLMTARECIPRAAGTRLYHRRVEKVGRLVDSVRSAPVPKFDVVRVDSLNSFVSFDLLQNLMKLRVSDL